MNKEDLRKLLMKHASTFPTTIKNVGNSSNMVVIPHELIKLWKLKEGDEVIVTIMKTEDK